MTQDKIRRKKKNWTDIFPSNRSRRGKFDEGDGPTMTELHMATIQAEARWRFWNAMIWSERKMNQLPLSAPLLMDLGGLMEKWNLLMCLLFIAVWSELPLISFLQLSYSKYMYLSPSSSKQLLSWITFVKNASHWRRKKTSGQTLHKCSKLCSGYINKFCQCVFANLEGSLEFRKHNSPMCWRKVEKEMSCLSSHINCSHH